MPNSVGSPSSKGDGQCGPYQTTALQGSGISLSHFRLAKSPALQENSGNLDLCFEKSKTEKEERKGKGQESEKKREGKKKRRKEEKRKREEEGKGEEEEEGKHVESYLCSSLH